MFRGMDAPGHFQGSPELGTKFVLQI